MSSSARVLVLRKNELLTAFEAAAIKYEMNTMQIRKILVHLFTAFFQQTERAETAVRYPCSEAWKGRRS